MTLDWALVPLLILLLILAISGALLTVHALCGLLRPLVGARSSGPERRRHAPGRQVQRG